LGHSQLAAQADTDSTSRVEHSSDQASERPTSRKRAGYGGFHIGDGVFTSSSLWPPRFANKTGTVANLNIRDTEVGLWLGGYGGDGHRSVIWFRLSQIEALDTATAPSGARRSDRSGRPGVSKATVAA
jgi:hypothetical protein